MGTTPQRLEECILQIHSISSKILVCIPAPGGASDMCREHGVEMEKAVSVCAVCNAVLCTSVKGG